MVKERRCKDCGPKVNRPAPYPGPRCATHHRLFLRQQKARAHELMVARVYGLEGGEYARYYEAQGGTCAICQRANGRTKRLAVDHNHRTGVVRGLLCGPCNQFVGYVGDNPQAFLRAAKYLGRG